MKSRPPRPLPAPLAIGLGLLATALTAGLVRLVLHGARFEPDRSPTVTCRPATLSHDGIVNTAQPPAVFDVDGDGDEELITLQVVPHRGRGLVEDELFLLALSPTHGGVRWRAPLGPVRSNRSRNATAREFLFVSSGRALHIDARGNLQGVELTTGAVVTSTTLSGGFQHGCNGPEGSHRVWLDAEYASRDVMVNDRGEALPEPRPTWCPDVRGRSFACARSGTADCRRIAPSFPGPTLPDFEGALVLSTARFTVALGRNTRDNRPVLAGLGPSPEQVVWIRTISPAPGGPSQVWTGPDRGEIANDRVYAAHPVHGGWNLAALDAATGALAWDVELPCVTGHPFAQNPTGLTATLTRVFVQTEVATLALDVNTGATRWIIAQTAP